MVRSLNNLYYIELGKIRERERILALLEDWVFEGKPSFNDLIDVIRHERILDKESK